MHRGTFSAASQMEQEIQRNPLTINAVYFTKRLQYNWKWPNHLLETPIVARVSIFALLIEFSNFAI